MNEIFDPNKDFDDLAWSNYNETNSVITIRFPSKPVIFVDNRFSNNIGTLGVINIFTPIFQHNAFKPAIIFKDNIFQNNMAYFAGNVFYILLRMVTDYSRVD